VPEAKALPIELPKQYYSGYLISIEKGMLLYSMIKAIHGTINVQVAILSSTSDAL
jgi:hypothetical protein